MIERGRLCKLFSRTAAAAHDAPAPAPARSNGGVGGSALAPPPHGGGGSVAAAPWQQGSPGRWRRTCQPRDAGEIAFGVISVLPEARNVGGTCRAGPLKSRPGRGPGSKGWKSRGTHIAVLGDKGYRHRFGRVCGRPYHPIRLLRLQAAGCRRRPAGQYHPRIFRFGPTRSSYYLNRNESTDRVMVPNRRSISNKDV